MKSILKLYWFKSVYSQVLQDTLKRLDKAFQAFFCRVKNGETPGFPKYKKRGQWNSITYSQYHNRPTVTHRYGHIKVPKIGQIKICYHRYIPDNAKIKTLTISREGGKWFACFSFEFELKVEHKQDENGKYLLNGASWKSRLNKSILDAGWGMFLNILMYKTSKQGKKVVKVKPNQTSQVCSNCGCIVPKTLSIRTHVCPECGFVANRDYNAALNILRLGLQSLA